MRWALVSFFSSSFFSSLCLFSCPGKVNTHPLCSCFLMVTVEQCMLHSWFYCLDCHEKRQGRQVSISGRAHSKQMRPENGERDENAAGYTHTHTQTHTYTHTGNKWFVNAQLPKGINQTGFKQDLVRTVLVDVICILKPHLRKKLVHS